MRCCLLRKVERAFCMCLCLQRYVNFTLHVLFFYREVLGLHFANVYLHREMPRVHLTVVDVYRYMSKVELACTGVYREISECAFFF